MQVIKCNDEVLKKIPNIFGLIQKEFGEKEITMYACVDEHNNLSFIVFDNLKGILINSQGHKSFTVDKNLELQLYKSANYNVMLGKNSTPIFLDDSNNEYSLRFEHLDEPDSEDYNGSVVFNQYHFKDDLYCQLTYPHMSRTIDGKPYIYSYHTKNPSIVYIEEESSKDHDRSFGLIGKKIKCYNRYSFNRGMIGYNLVLLNEHGLVDTILYDSYYLEREDPLRRFTKAQLVINGQYYDTWPFCSFYKPSDVEQMIEDYGFMVSIPEEMLNIYNNQDRNLSDLNSILEQLKEEELQKECAMRLKLVP